VAQHLGGSTSFLRKAQQFSSLFRQHHFDLCVCVAKQCLPSVFGPSKVMICMCIPHVERGRSSQRVWRSPRINYEVPSAKTLETFEATPGPLVSVLKGSMTRSSSCRTEVRSSERMNEGDISEHMAWARAQIAVEGPARLGAVRGAERAQIPPFAAGGKAQAADDWSKRCVEKGHIC
jgi:hypothetical protein